MRLTRVLSNQRALLKHSQTNAMSSKVEPIKKIKNYKITKEKKKKSTLRLIVAFN